MIGLSILCSMEDSVEFSLEQTINKGKLIYSEVLESGSLISSCFNYRFPFIFHGFIIYLQKNYLCIRNLDLEITKKIFIEIPNLVDIVFYDISIQQEEIFITLNKEIFIFHIKKQSFLILRYLYFIKSPLCFYKNTLCFIDNRDAIIIVDLKTYKKIFEYEPEKVANISDVSFPPVLYSHYVFYANSIGEIIRINRNNKLIKTISLDYDDKMNEDFLLIDKYIFALTDTSFTKIHMETMEKVSEIKKHFISPLYFKNNNKNNNNKNNNNNIIIHKDTNEKGRFFLSTNFEILEINMNMEIVKHKYFAHKIFFENKLYIAYFQNKKIKIIYNDQVVLKDNATDVKFFFHKNKNYVLIQNELSFKIIQLD